MLILSCALVAHSFLGQIEAIEPKETLPAIEPAEPQLFENPAEPSPTAPVIKRAPLKSMDNPKYPPGSNAFVNATSLALRTGPNTSAALIHYIIKDEVVTVLKDVVPPVPLTIGEKSGFWIYIQHKNHKGYVFDAFLGGAPPSLKDSLDLVCVPGKKVGGITVKTTYQDLARMVGEVNLGMARIPLEEKGKFEEATAVFPGDKHKELIIQWDVFRVNPKAVIVNGGNWKTASGIGIGTRLDDILAKNEVPISFLGFGHEYAGFVTSWGAGRLESTHQLRKSMLLYLSPEKPYTSENYAAVQGEGEFSSVLDPVKELNLKVSSMIIMLK